MQSGESHSEPDSSDAAAASGKGKAPAHAKPCVAMMAGAAVGVALLNLFEALESLFTAIANPRGTCRCGRCENVGTSSQPVDGQSSASRN